MCGPIGRAEIQSCAVSPLCGKKIKQALISWKYGNSGDVMKKTIQLIGSQLNKITLTINKKQRWLTSISLHCMYYMSVLEIGSRTNLHINCENSCWDKFPWISRNSSRICFPVINRKKVLLPVELQK